MGVENANIRTVHKFLNNFLNNTNVPEQKFIWQLVIRDNDTWIRHFGSESKQQSIQWNERTVKIYRCQTALSAKNTDSRLTEHR